MIYYIEQHHYYHDNSYIKSVDLNGKGCIHFSNIKTYFSLKKARELLLQIKLMNNYYNSLSRIKIHIGD